MGRSDDCVSAFKSERSAFRLFQQIDQSRRRCTLRNLNPNLAILPGPLIESNDQRVAVFGLLHRQRTGKRKSKGNSVSSFFSHCHNHCQRHFDSRATNWSYIFRRCANECGAQESFARCPEGYGTPISSWFGARRGHHHFSYALYLRGCVNVRALSNSVYNSPV